MGGSSPSFCSNHTLIALLHNHQNLNQNDELREHQEQSIKQTIIAHTDNESTKC